MTESDAAGPAAAKAAPAAASAGNGALLDEGRWSALCESLLEDGLTGSLPPVLGEIVARYAPTSQRRLEDLRAALSTGHTQEAGEVLHAMRGGSAMLGAVRVERIAHDLELRLTDGAPPAETDPLVSELERACTETAQTLQARLTPEQ